MTGPLAPGRTVERYRVEELLGEGGTAVVWRVRHVHLGTDHALKVVTLPGAQGGARLLLEGRVQAGLRHPNIVAVTDVLEIDGSFGLLMEYVPPPSLAAWLQQYGPPPVERAEALFRGVVEGVRHAHAHGLVHRDLKPANVLLARGDAARGESELVPKVADFGLARLLDPLDGEGAHRHTRSGLAMGTPQYMAPEQFRDAKSVDRRADLFSLGCILHELLTGAPAFAWTDMIGVYGAMLGERWAPLPSGVPERLRNAVAGCLAADPDARIPDCGTLLAVLDGGTRGPTLVPGAASAAGTGGARVLAPAPPIRRDAPTLVTARDPAATITLPPDSGATLAGFAAADGAPLAGNTATSAAPERAPNAVAAPPSDPAPQPEDASPRVPARPSARLGWMVAAGVALLGLVWIASRPVAPEDAPPAAPEPTPALVAPASPPAPANPTPPTRDDRGAPSTPASAAASSPAAPQTSASPSATTRGASAPSRPASTRAPTSTTSTSTRSPVPTSPGASPPGASPPDASAAPAPAPSPTASPPSAPAATDTPLAEAGATATTARVAASGADTVWLVGPDGRQPLPAAVKPGRYAVWADFGAGAVDAGAADLSAGDDVRVVCNASFHTCRVRR